MERRGSRLIFLLVVVFSLLVSGEAAREWRLDDDKEGKAMSNKAQQQFEAPWFYHGLEGPEFQIVSNASEYTVRQYPGTDRVRGTGTEKRKANLSNHLYFLSLSGLLMSDFQYPFYFCNGIESFWSATTVTGKSMDDAGREAFMRLFRYISGVSYLYLPLFLIHTSPKQRSTFRRPLPQHLNIIILPFLP